ncbi:MAG TPA: hypothetical protein VIP98_08070, partial [Microlunatus sp.]
DGLMSRSGGQTGEEVASSEPMPDWERELLGQGQEGEAPAEAVAEAEALTPADEKPAVAAENAEQAADKADSDRPEN